MLLVAVGYTAFFGRNYTSSAVFVVQSRRTPNGLGGLAAQFGVALPSEQASQSPQFYADLLLSAELLARLTGCQVRPGDANEAETLLEYLRPGKGHEDERRERAVRRLRVDLISVPSARSGTIAVHYSDHDRSVSFAVIGCALKLVDEYNQQTRRTTASAERRFTEGRFVIAEDSLRVAEQALQEFLSSNRADLKSSPKLLFQYDRMNRRVQQSQELLNTVRQMLEQARLEEVRDTPAITVVEPPRMPALRDAGGVSRAAIIGLFLGAFLVALGLVLRDGWPTVRSRLYDLSDIGGAHA